MREAIYKTRIAPRVFHGVEASPSPTLVLVAGEAGAGVAGVRDALKNEFGAHGAAVLNSDMMRASHPRYRALALADERSARTHTDPDAVAWMDRAVDDARRRRVNVAMQSTLRDPAHALDVVNDFKRAGYRVEIRALAVPERDTLRGQQHRDAALQARNEPGRPMDAADHRDNMRQLPDALRRLEVESTVDRVAILRRNGQVLYDNQKIEGQWTMRPPIADRALQMERDRVRTREEMQQRAVEWSVIEQLVGSRSTSSQATRAAVATELKQARDEFREHLNKIPPPGRGEATQRSLEQALRIAQALGGAGAQLAAPAPGRTYKGPVLGETAEHIVQGGATTSSYIAHAKRDLAEIPAVAKIVDVRYPTRRDHQASVTELKLPIAKRDITPDRDHDR